MDFDNVEKTRNDVEGDSAGREAVLQTSHWLSGRVLRNWQLVWVQVALGGLSCLTSSPAAPVTATLLGTLLCHKGGALFLSFHPAAFIDFILVWISHFASFTHHKPQHFHHYNHHHPFIMFERRDDM